jgi:hypothetical protein
MLYAPSECLFMAQKGTLRSALIPLPIRLSRISVMPMLTRDLRREELRKKLKRYPKTNYD